MFEYKEILIYIAAFIWVVIASNQLSRYFQIAKLPLITGFLICGIVAGPYVLGLIEQKALHNLYFINDISLAFIAFAAGSERLW